MSAEDRIRDSDSTIFGRTVALDQYLRMAKDFGQLPVPHLANRAVSATVESLKPGQVINVRTAVGALILELDSEMPAFDLEGTLSE